MEWVSSSLSLIPPRSLLDALPIRETLAAWQHPDAPRSTSGSRPVIAARPSRTSYSRSRRPPDGLGGQSWRFYRDEGISGTRGRDKRPGLDALLKGVARREFDIVAAWSVCRLGRSLSDLIGLLGELRSRDIDLYLHQQALDTSTPSGRMLFGMLGVFSEFERAMIPRPGVGRAGSRSIIWQAPGQAEDDAVPGSAYPRCAG
jgi:hypothetical protein